MIAPKEVKFSGQKLRRLKQIAPKNRKKRKKTECSDPSCNRSHQVSPTLCHWRLNCPEGATHHVICARDKTNRNHQIAKWLGLLPKFVVDGYAEMTDCMWTTKLKSKLNHMVLMLRGMTGLILVKSKPNTPYWPNVPKLRVSKRKRVVLIVSSAIILS